MPGSKEVNLATRPRARKPCLVYILQSVCSCNAVFNTFPSSISLSHQEVLVTRLHSNNLFESRIEDFEFVKKILWMLVDAFHLSKNPQVRHSWKTGPASCTLLASVLYSAGCVHKLCSTQATCIAPCTTQVVYMNQFSTSIVSILLMYNIGSIDLTLFQSRDQAPGSWSKLRLK